MKQEKGITLIALVITIIVLLILAGVTIAMIAGNDSAPTKAAQAKVENVIGAAKDTIAINAANLMTEFYEKKYVGASDTSNAASAEAYIRAAAQTSKLFQNVTGATHTSVDTTSGEFTITSNEYVASGSSKAYFSVVGTVGAGGAITWQTGTWAVSGS